MKFCDRIRVRREELNLSQDELAKRMGYKSRSTINKIELGINDVSQSKIVAFAEALETTVGYLMGDEDAPKEVESPNLNEEVFALWGEIHDLTEGEKKDIMEYIKFKKNQRKNQ